MWRYLAGAGAGVLLVVAGMMLQAMRPGPRTTLAAMPAAAAATDSANSGAVAVPEATPKTREEKRFNRYDKDRNGAITRDEYLASRKKAYARLDVDGNGTLSFDEWATKAEAKFALADKDKSGAMNAVEFATTAVKRKEPVRAKCPPGKPGDSADGKDDDT
jgi:hypothetical protein